MSLVFLLSVLLFITAITFARPDWKANIAITGVCVQAVFSSWKAIEVLGGKIFLENFYGGKVFADIPIRLDALSSWFVLLTNFTIITGALYGRQYLKESKCTSSVLSLHYINLIVNQAALTGLYFIQHGLLFLCFWEIMALSAFLLVIFEHGRMETLKAGINYLIQSHISIVFLTLGFIWVYSKTGSFDFNSIYSYCLTGGNEACLLLFLVFFTGFGIKAGIVPFHTWLPYAHPAAPSHVSGMMSGVIIKTGIYGIMRMILLMPDNRLALGYFILIISVISGLYGVILAIVQHNLKRLLAYHSIENIGIIGIGIGIGTLGSGMNNNFMVFAGYGGALMHTLNHSLFKSLLFYCAGSVYHTAHTLIIDRMGGLIRKIPINAVLFLVASLAICGLPPFNGFVSEFLIYSGLFNAIGHNQSSALIILAVAGLALIGGLALLCFTKAFGIIFLGTERHPNSGILYKENWHALIPKFMAAALIAGIGLFPQFFMEIIIKPVELYTPQPPPADIHDLFGMMQSISFVAWLMIGITGLLVFIRWLVLRRRLIVTDTTWACGYDTTSPRLQYTASSFVKPYVKIIKPVLEIKKTSEQITDIIPKELQSESHFYDKVEKGLVDWPVRNLRACLGRFKFLQNGSVQFYMLYGVVFIGICITIPLIIDALSYLIEILKQL